MRASEKTNKRRIWRCFVSDRDANAAGVFTQNVVKAAPVLWDKKLCMEMGKCRALVVNSGVANACTGDAGYQDTEHIAAFAAQELGVPKESVAVASTGVIGIRLPMDTIEQGIQKLSNLISDDLESGSAAAEAIRTTDICKKRDCSPADDKRQECYDWRYVQRFGHDKSESWNGACFSNNGFEYRTESA